MKAIDLNPLAKQLSLFSKISHPRKLVLVRNCES
jgi:broad specificity phosphatase PhoE